MGAAIRKVIQLQSQRALFPSSDPIHFHSRHLDSVTAHTQLLPVPGFDDQPLSKLDFQVCDETGSLANTSVLWFTMYGLQLTLTQS